MDLVFAFDSSESIKVYPMGQSTKYIWRKITDTARAVVANLPIGLAINKVQVAAVRFAATTNVMFYLDRFENSLEAQFAINSIPLDMGNTNLATMLNTINGDVFTISRGMRLNKMGLNNIRLLLGYV